MKTSLVSEDELDFDLRIFDCIERALTLIGKEEKEMILHKLALQFGESGFDIAKDPYALEECLRESLGAFEAASVLVQILENISRSFKIVLREDCNLAEVIAEARNKVVLRRDFASDSSENEKGVEKKPKVKNRFQLA